MVSKNFAIVIKKLRCKVLAKICFLTPPFISISNNVHFSKPINEAHQEK